MADDGAFRVRACAVIVRGGQILLIECDEAGFGLHYNLPGGGVQHGEPVRAAVQREVREEAGVEVEVGRLLLSYEVLHPDVYRPAEMHHSFGLLFECTLLDGVGPYLPAAPDKFQIGVRWFPVEVLPTIRLLPFVGRDLYAVLNGTPGAPAFTHDDLGG